MFHLSTLPWPLCCLPKQRSPPRYYPSHHLEGPPHDFQLAPISREQSRTPKCGPAGGEAESIVRSYLPLAPQNGLSAFTLDSAETCLALIVAVGLLAGVYPAWKASRLRPAEVLRAE